jgi:[acyl-carrier-protein] S-malonyltransferase
MQPAADGLFQALIATPVHPPNLPVIANVDAKPHTDESAIRVALQRQLTHPVQWQRSIEFLLGEGFDTFVEVGPGRVLTGLMKKIQRAAKAINISIAADLKLDWVRNSMSN